jgi:hypothetical protein
MTAHRPDISVRLATKQDEDQLMDLCRALHEDNGLFTFDADMVRGMLYRAFNREGGLIGVIDGDNEIAAGIFMLISNFWYSQDNHLEELFSFVRPTYRKSRNHFDELSEFAERCSKQIGIPLIIGILTNKRMEAKVRLYRRKFGLPAGAFFVVGDKQWANESIIADGLLWSDTHKAKRHHARLAHSTMTTSSLPLLRLAENK